MVLQQAVHLPGKKRRQLTFLIPLSRSNSPDSAGPGRKLVLCVQLLSCVYISSVPVQQCVHLLSTASQQLCVHYLPNTVVLIYSTSWEKVFASRPWKLTQTTGLLKSFKMIYITRFILIFWLRYGHFKILPFCTSIINDYSVIFYNTNIGKTKRSV